MANRCSLLAWEIPWTEKPGGLQSVVLQRVRHKWAAEHARMGMDVPSNGADEGGPGHPFLPNTKPSAHSPASCHMPSSCLPQTLVLCSLSGLPAAHQSSLGYWGPGALAPWEGHGACSWKIHPLVLLCSGPSRWSGWTHNHELSIPKKEVEIIILTIIIPLLSCDLVVRIKEMMHGNDAINSQVDTWKRRYHC